MLCGACALLFGVPTATRARQEGAPLNESQLPARASGVGEFVPAGWVIEGQARGDLNNDALPDIALKLIQQKRAGGGEEVSDRKRVLIVLLRERDGKLRRAAVAQKLLQCTACGGAFYGVVEAPAEVTINRGTIVVSQDGGSRNVVEQTLRFRHDAASGKFLLIGADVSDRDRLTAEVTTESTNYLTGRKITTSIKPAKRGRRDVRKTTAQTIGRKRITIEEVDAEAL